MATALPAKLTLNNTFAQQLDTINFVIDYLTSPLGTTRAGAIAIFDDVLTNNVTIGPNQRGLAVDMTVQNGVTLTVQSGGVMVVL